MCDEGVLEELWGKKMVLENAQKPVQPGSHAGHIFIDLFVHS